MLMNETKSQSPHRLLTAYVQLAANFAPTDAIDLEEEEEDLTPTTHDELQKIHPLDFTKLGMS
jgi:hypothetical protein